MTLIPRKTDPQQAGAWWAKPEPNEPGKLWNPAGCFALFRCPNGHIGALAQPDHSISAEGIVIPSAVCPRAGCSFHAHIKLEGWTP